MVGHLAYRIFKSTRKQLFLTFDSISLPILEIPFLTEHFRAYYDIRNPRIVWAVWIRSMDRLDRLDRQGYADSKDNYENAFVYIFAVGKKIWRNLGN